MNLKNLQAIREAKGLSIDELAITTLIPNVYIQSLEAGYQGVEDFTAADLAAALGVQISDLTGEADEPSNEGAVTSRIDFFYLYNMDNIMYQTNVSNRQLRARLKNALSLSYISDLRTKQTRAKRENAEKIADALQVDLPELIHFTEDFTINEPVEPASYDDVLESLAVINEKLDYLMNRDILVPTIQTQEEADVVTQGKSQESEGWLKRYFGR